MRLGIYRYPLCEKKIVLFKRAIAATMNQALKPPLYLPPAAINADDPAFKGDFLVEQIWQCG